MADKSGLLDKFLISSEEEVNYHLPKGIGPSIHEVEINQLLSHPDFEDHLERAISMNRFALAQSMILRERILEILNLLNDEITARQFD